ncbi:MAG: hypothetical protein JWL92_33 [Candidatus Nomurabacteria bacterium]|nr:hypothetical protein [Candidatus Nomurabacteria bacterium]
MKPNSWLFLIIKKIIFLIISFLVLETLVHVHWGIVEIVFYGIVVAVLFAHNGSSGEVFEALTDRKRTWYILVPHFLFLGILYVSLVTWWITNGESVENGKLFAQFSILSMALNIAFHYYVLFSEYRIKCLLTFSSPMK